MRGCSALFLFFALVLFSPSLLAQEAPRLAFIPYLSMNVEPDEEEAIREAITIELTAQSRLRLVSRQQIQKKLSMVPDGCPELPDCVASLASQVQAQYLLFLIILRKDTGYHVTLTLRQVGADNPTKISIELTEDTTLWSNFLRKGLNSILPKEAKQPELPTTLLAPPNTAPTPINTTPNRSQKRLFAGALLAGAGLFLLFYRPIPDATLGDFGPGAR